MLRFIFPRPSPGQANATYEKVGLIPQVSRALHLELFLKAVHLRILDL
jgi:hypothetical protein